MWEGVDLQGLRQTDSRQAAQSCADPSLSSTELESARRRLLSSSLSHRPPASPRIIQLQGRWRWAEGTFLFVTFSTPSKPPSSRGSTGLRALGDAAFVVVTSARSAQQVDAPPGCPPPRRSHLHGCTMATFVCRVQFLDDTDPFNSTNFPEPTRPPVYTFREDIPLINQIAGVHRLLKAPHKVGRPLVTHYCELIRNSTRYWYFPDCFCCVPTSNLTFPPHF